MATIDWPTTRHFLTAEFQIGVEASFLGFTGFKTGNRSRLSNLADRLVATVTLPPTLGATEMAEREAFILGLLSTGDYVRFGIPHRRTTGGTITGSPTVGANVLAGARSVTINTSAAATIAGGGFIGIGGNLLQAAYTGATANGSGVMTLPLALPAPAAVTSGAAITITAPTGLWELDTDALQVSYAPGIIQGAVVLPFRQYIA